jgi:hypothetical protein
MSQQSLSAKIPPSCLLCNDWEQALRKSNPQFRPGEEFCVTPKQYVKHVGAHMEQLALFAIPRGCTDEHNSDSNSHKVLQSRDGALSTISDWRSQSSQIRSDHESLIRLANPLVDAPIPVRLPSATRELRHSKSPESVENYGLGGVNASDTDSRKSQASTTESSVCWRCCRCGRMQLDDGGPRCYNVLCYHNRCVCCELFHADGEHSQSASRIPCLNCRKSRAKVSDTLRLSP